MNEFTQAQLLDRVIDSRVAAGNPRVREITARIVGDLFRAIDDSTSSPTSSGPVSTG